MKDILGPSVGFTDLLDHEITERLKGEAENRKAGKIRYHPLRPSASGHCSRKLALELMEYRGKAFYNKPIIDPNIDRLFSLGHSVEYSVLRSFELVDLIQQRYKQQSLTLFTLDRGPDFPKEIVEGSCDVCFWSPKFKAICDVKSKKDGFSGYFKTKWDELLAKLSGFKSLSKISEQAFYADDISALIEEFNYDWMIDNILQLNLYANADFMKERDVNFASLIYYNKNDSRMFELRFKPSKEVFNHVQEKFNRVAKIVDQEKVEDLVCEFPIGSMRYAFCDCHKMLPYDRKDPVKAYFSTLPKKTWAKRVGELPNSRNLVTLYESYRTGKEGEAEAQKAESRILEILTKQKVNKVQFEDGLIYEVKYLKSPKEHFELRRTKQ